MAELAVISRETQNRQVALTNQQVAPVNQQAAVEDASSEIDLVELFYYMLEKAWIIAVVAIAAAAITGLYTHYFVAPTYESTAILYVLNSKDSVIQVADLTVGSQLTNDYLQLFKLRTINEEVIRNLSLPYTQLQLQKMVTVTNPTNTRHLSIAVRSNDPDEAQLIANAFAKAAQSTIKEKMKNDEPTELEAAVASTIPVAPSLSRNTLYGGLVGALLVIGVLFLIFVMDDKIKSQEDISKYFGLATLAVVPVVGVLNPKAPTPTPINKGAKVRRRKTSI
ncbi:hypothetical protein AGMMS49992_05410 [Clostridia bacterium]|nr:hypothetical protein AGMMS49992_05410 [Clostridia bacterium]